MHVVPFTVAAAAAAGEVEIAADRRAAELAAVCQQSVGHRGSRLDGDVARSRQLAGDASPSSELADAGFANSIMLIRDWSSVTFCPYNVRQPADGLSCMNRLSDGAGVQTFVTMWSATSAADSKTVSDTTPVLPTLHVVRTSVVYSAIPNECRVSLDVVARSYCCWNGLSTPRQQLNTAIQQRHAEHQRGAIKLRLMSSDKRVDCPDTHRRSRRHPLAEWVGDHVSCVK